MNWDLLGLKYAYHIADAFGEFAGQYLVDYGWNEITDFYAMYVGAGGEL